MNISKTRRKENLFNVFAISVSSQTDEQRVFLMNKYSKRQKNKMGKQLCNTLTQGVFQIFYFENIF